MASQVFKSIFTADVSQYRGEMQVLRQSTSNAVGEIRNTFAAIAGFSIAGYGVKELVGNVIRLGAEMQQTKTAFEVMLGSASAAERVIGELNHFADVTPFDNDEVIKSGRLLMNAGVATGQLAEKLTTLGNIAAGAQVPLLDMVAIYSKAANKGKVQAEELNQLSERGVPVMQALSATLGRTTQEILEMGAKGQLSFALLDEALASLSAEGGRYFGLMDKQSQNLAGRWSVVTAAIRNTGIAIGEEAIPALSAALEEFAAALDEMSQSGELDTIVKDTARSIGEIASGLKDITVWMIRHQKEIKAIAKGALWIGVAIKTRTIIMNLVSGLDKLAIAHAAQAAAAATSATATGAAGAAASAAGTAAAGASVKVGLLATSLKGVGAALGAVGAMGATAFIGWKIGEVFAELLNLEEVFTRLILKMRGLTDAEIAGSALSGPVSPSLPKYDLAKAEKEKDELEAKLARLADVELPEGSDGRMAVEAEREGLTAKIASITAGIEDYRKRADSEIAAMEDTEKRVKAAAMRERELREEMEKAVAKSSKLGKGPVRRAYMQEIDKAHAELSKLNDLLQSQRRTAKQYKEARKELQEYRDSGKVEAAVRLSAADRFRAEEQKRLQDEVSEHLAKLTKGETELKRAEWARQMEEYRNAYRKAGMEAPEHESRLNELEDAGYASIDEERKKKIQGLHDQLAKLTMSETEMKKRELARQLEEYRKAGATREQLARLQAAELAQIETDRNRKVLDAWKQLEAARRNLAEHQAGGRLDAMMRKLDRIGARLRKDLDKFGFSPEDGWRELEGSPRERRERKRNLEMDARIEEKMAALGRGEKARFTKAEKERIRERERAEGHLEANERTRRREQRDFDRRLRSGQEKELARAVQDAGRDLAGLRERPARGWKRRQPVLPPVGERSWLGEIRPETKPSGRAPDVVGALEGAADYGGQLDQILQQVRELNKQVFVVKGA
jgi:tape measure domain-containing protein